MPLAITCPTCHHPLSVNASPVAYVATCPTCRNPLTVPATAAPAAPEPEPILIAEPPARRPRYRAGASLGGRWRAFVVALAVGVPLGLGAVGWALLANRGPAPRSDPATKVEPAPAPGPKAAPPPKREIPAPSAERDPESVKPAPTFAEAWGAALNLSLKLDAEEPEQTRKAMALLTAEEKQKASFEMRGRPEELYDAGGKLIRLGLRAWVLRASRKVALADDKLKTLAPALWDPDTGAAGVVEMMNVWGLFSEPVRIDVAVAISQKKSTESLSPEVRNAILDLGGAKWLAR